MLIRRFDRSQFFDAFDVQAQMIFPWEGAIEAPFKSAWGLVGPGLRVKPHAHHDSESYFIFRGNGVMIVDGERAEVKAGDVICVPPFEPHILENSSAQEDLLFLSCWWEDMNQVQEAKRDLPASSSTRYLVIASPPTPNGYMHLGHLAGPYLGGDFHTRYLRLRGAEVSYISHTDDNESYIRLKAKQLGQGDRETADEFATAIKRTLNAADIELDSFLRPNESPEHTSMVEKIFNRLYDDGKLISRQVATPYCESCDLFLFESYVIGKCPHCGHDSDAFVCERCFRPIDCTELEERHCAFCGETPCERPFERLFFPLSLYTEELKEFYRRSDMGPCIRSLCERMLQDGLPDIAFTHRVGWGTPVSVKGFEDQTIYGAFEVFAAFLTACQRLSETVPRDHEAGHPEGWRRFFTADDTEVVQLFGSDNCYFFGVLYPAVALAYDPEIRLPSRLITNEYYLLEGEKFSTTRQHLILAEEMLAQVPSDVLRFYLAYTAPETQRTNFDGAEFKSIAEGELIGNWESWLQDLATRVEQEYGGEAPGTGVWIQHHRRYYQQLADLIGEATVAYEAPTFSPQKAARVLCELVRLARRFRQAEAHWTGVEYCGDERQMGLVLELASAKTLAILSAPILPTFARSLWLNLGYSKPLGPGSWEETPTWVPPGQRIGKLGGPYFSLETTSHRDQDAQ